MKTPPEDAFGFVYEITNIKTGRKYIGKKQFHSTRTRKVVGKKRRTKTVKESDWKTYFGSCEELRQDVLKYGAKNFKREVLEICRCKRDLSYAEAREQFARNVLYAQLPDGTKAFYNGNVLNRFYA